MGRDDWYRNTDWTAATEAAFRARLSRSRSGRPQYLRIQAGCLADRHPAAALALIDEYFETGDQFDVPNAWCVRAEAWLALGNAVEAVVAYKSALEYEESRPGHVSNARLHLPQLVAEKRIAGEYDYALEILACRFRPSDHLFPVARYVWNGSCALILHELGRTAEAREHAERALRAAETQSPFRYHRRVGLVEDSVDAFGRRIKQIARPSRVRSLFRLISGR